MKPWRLGLGLGGVGLLALVIVWAERLASPWMWTLGLALGQFLAPTAPPGRAAEVDWDAVEREVAAADVPSKGNEQTTPKGAKSHGKSSPQDGGALFVSAQRVLELSKRAQVPASRYVPASGKRPAGLQVAGVGGLGIGVKDGDVLTKVAGAEVRSGAAVISTVLKLRAKRATAISGEFWRGQERWQIVFEMPYVESRAPSDPGSESKPPEQGQPAAAPKSPVAASSPPASDPAPAPRGAQP